MLGGDAGQSVADEALQVSDQRLVASGDRQQQSREPARALPGWSDGCDLGDHIGIGLVRDACLLSRRSITPPGVFSVARGRRRKRQMIVRGADPHGPASPPRLSLPRSPPVWQSKCRCPNPLPRQRHRGRPDGIGRRRRAYRRAPIGSHPNATSVSQRRHVDRQLPVTCRSLNSRVSSSSENVQAEVPRSSR